MRGELGEVGKRVERYSEKLPSDWDQPFTFLKDWSKPVKGANADGSPNLEVVAPVVEVEARTYMWDPVRVICLRLEIADCIKAEGLKAYFWRHARQFVLGKYGAAPSVRFDMPQWNKCFQQQRSFDGELVPVVGRIDPERLAAKDDPYSNRQESIFEIKKRFWIDWKGYKRSGEYDKEVWAHECGFASYARMRKACMLTYDLSPQILEKQVIEEIAAYYSAHNTLNNRKMILLDPELPATAKPAAPFGDEYEVQLEFQGEWMERMRTIFG